MLMICIKDRMNKNREMLENKKKKKKKIGKSRYSN